MGQITIFLIGNKLTLIISLKKSIFSQEDIAKDFYEALIHTILQDRGPQTGVQASNFGGIHECVLFS
jgi:hypothetical protein